MPDTLFHLTINSGHKIATRRRCRAYPCDQCNRDRSGEEEL